LEPLPNPRVYLPGCSIAHVVESTPAYASSSEKTNPTPEKRPVSYPLRTCSQVDHVSGFEWLANAPLGRLGTFVGLAPGVRDSYTQFTH